MPNSKEWYDKLLEDFKQFVEDPQIMDYSEWAGDEEEYVGFHVSAESGNLIDGVRAWDYYGENAREIYKNDWKTHYKMEKFLEEHDAWAEWNTPGDLNIYHT